MIMEIPLLLKWIHTEEGGKHNMTINLNVRDRLVIISILPQNGSLEEMVEILEIVKKIKFSEEEKQDIKYIQNENKIEWDLDKDLGRDFEFSIDQIKILKDCVKELDKNKKIDLNLLDTCIKINKL